MNVTPKYLQTLKWQGEFTLAEKVASGFVNVVERRLIQRGSPSRIEHPPERSWPCGNGSDHIEPEPCSHAANRAGLFESLAPKASQHFRFDFRRTRHEQAAACLRVAANSDPADCRRFSKFRSARRVRSCSRSRRRATGWSGGARAKPRGWIWLPAYRKRSSAKFRPRRGDRISGRAACYAWPSASQA